MPSEVSDVGRALERKEGRYFLWVVVFGVPGIGEIIYVQVLSRDVILQCTGKRDLGSVERLNVWGAGFKDIGILKELSNIRVLSLSDNQIESLEVLRHCPNLEELYVRNNNISDLAQIGYLRSLKNLRILWVADNPCASHAAYRAFVIGAVPQISILDNERVTRDDRHMAELAWKRDDVRIVRHRAAAMLRHKATSATPTPVERSPPPPPAPPVVEETHPKIVSAVESLLPLLSPSELDKISTTIKTLLH